MSIFEEALSIESLGDAEWRAHADKRCEANTGMFGGWTAGVMLKCVLADKRAEGDPIAITTNFISRISPNEDVTIRSIWLGGGRSLNTFRAEIFTAEKDQPCATATITMANRRTSDQFTQYKMPEAPSPDGLTNFSPPGPFGATVDFRMVKGFPPFNQPDTRSLHWIREVSARKMDSVLLVYLADCYPPRIFMKSEGPRPSSTINMSVYFHSTAQELADVGDDFLLSEVEGVRAEHSSVGSKLNFWSPSGTLIATSEQLCWFR